LKIANKAQEERVEGALGRPKGPDNSTLTFSSGCTEFGYSLKAVMELLSWLDMVAESLGAILQNEIICMVRNV
jgi:hypothetical protein